MRVSDALGTGPYLGEQGLSGSWGLPELEVVATGHIDTTVNAFFTKSLEAQVLCEKKMQGARMRCRASEELASRRVLMQLPVIRKVSPSESFQRRHGSGALQEPDLVSVSTVVVVSARSRTLGRAFAQARRGLAPNDQGLSEDCGEPQKTDTSERTARLRFLHMYLSTVL